MTLFLERIISGINLGSIYAIIALGYTMVYGIARMLNFAHGDVIMVGAYICFVAISSFSLPPAVGILLAVVVCTVLGITIERLAYRPLRQAAPLAVLITAIGVSYLLQNLAQLIWTANPKSFPLVIDTMIKDAAVFLGIASPEEIAASSNFGTVVLYTSESGATLRLTGTTIVTILANIVIMIALTQFTSRTKMGKAMRAVSEDRGAAELMGISVNRTIAVTFAIGSALAAIAGVLLCSSYQVLQPTTGSMPGIKAFTAAVFGGIGSIPGAMIGGILLGVIEILGGAYVSTQLSDAFVFAVLIVVLLVKPTGLLGKKANEKVWGERDEAEKIHNQQPHLLRHCHRGVCGGAAFAERGPGFPFAARAIGADLRVHRHGGIAQPHGGHFRRTQPGACGLYERGRVLRRGVLPVDDIADCHAL